MNSASTAISPREKLISSASRQFFHFGYRGVGIDKIIKDASIAKATFYAHFPSKEALYTEVLKKTSDDSIAFFLTFAQSRNDPLDKFLAPIDFLLQFLPDAGFRGCPFINMTAEIYDFSARARQIGREHYEKYRGHITQFARELADANPVQYKHLRRDAIADQYMTIYTGALALTALWQKNTPLHSAKELVLALARYP